MNAVQLRASIAKALEFFSCGHVHAGVAVLQAIPKATRKPKAAPATSEPMARFCPGCGWVGEVDPRHRDCCPDGDKARVIPRALADHCHNLWSIAMSASLAQRHGMVMTPKEPTDDQVQAGVDQVQAVLDALGAHASAETLARVAYDGMIAARPNAMQPAEQEGAECL